MRPNFDIKAFLDEALKNTPGLAGDMNPPWVLKRRPMLGSGAPAAMPQGPVMPSEVPRGTFSPMLPERPPSFGQRFMSGGPLPALPPPRSNNERDVGGRMFLSGLVGGFNSRTGAGAGGRAAGHSGASSDPLMEQLRRAEVESRIKANDAMAGTRDARKSAIEHPAEKVDPFEGDKHDWWKARTGSLDALTGRRNRPDRAGSGRGGRGGAGGKPPTEAAERAQINAEFSAEKQRIAGAFKQKYANVHDQTNAAGTSFGTGIRDAAISRGVADVEHRHQMALRRHAQKWGMDTALPDAGIHEAATTGKSTIDILNGH